MKASILFLIFSGCAFSPCFAKDEMTFHPAFDCEISTITYKEPGLMEESGTMYFLNCSLTERFNKEIFMREELRYGYGLVNYKGSTWAGTPLNIADIPDYLTEVRFVLGNDIPSFGSSFFTPYLGFGYRFLSDNSQLRSASGYRREANYLFSPIGVEFTSPLGKYSFWGTGIEYDSFISGRQMSYLSDADPGYHDAMNEQKRGYGLRASLKYSFASGDADYVIKIFETTWEIENSDFADLTKNGVNIGYVYEPKNISTEIGVSLSMKY